MRLRNTQLVFVNSKFFEKYFFFRKESTHNKSHISNKLCLKKYYIV